MFRNFRFRLVTFILRCQLDLVQSVEAYFLSNSQDYHEVHTVDYIETHKDQDLDVATVQEFQQS